MTHSTARKCQLTFAFLSIVQLCACGSGGESSGNSSPNSNCNTASEFCGNIPTSANACTDKQFWPLAMQSSHRPLTVHYSRAVDESVATQMVAILEYAWDVQVDSLGFAAPLDDGGACGSDGRYDVFLWRGVDGAFVDGVADNLATPYDDYSTYMAIDPSGDYGGSYLDTTLTHEFNHALQASDDWWESSMVYEMSATFVEALVYPDQSDYFYTTIDFQQHPQWSLFYYDNFRTWYMYGAAMYLHFLSEKYFPADPGFIARIWRMCRSDPAIGRPDFIDAIRAVLLTDRGIEFDDTVVEFMQWRWFVAELDDGAHFLHGSEWPTPVTVIEANASAPSISVDFSAMIYGGNYLRIDNDSASDRQFSVDVHADSADVIWKLTSVYGDEVAASMVVPALSSLILVASVVPLAPVSLEELDFERRTSVLSLAAL